MSDVRHPGTVTPAAAPATDAPRPPRKEESRPMSPADETLDALPTDPNHIFVSMSPDEIERMATAIAVRDSGDAAGKTLIAVIAAGQERLLKVASDRATAERERDAFKADAEAAERALDEQMAPAEKALKAALERIDALQKTIDQQNGVIQGMANCHTLALDHIAAGGLKAAQGVIAQALTPANGEGGA